MGRILIVDIGKRLRDLREAKGLSQDDIAARIGVPQTEISNIEHGNGMPTLPMLQGWATALGIDLHELFAVGRKQPEKSAMPKGTSVTAQERTLLELLRQMPEQDRSLLVSMARDMVKRKRTQPD